MIGMRMMSEIAALESVDFWKWQRAGKKGGAVEDWNQGFGFPVYALPLSCDSHTYWHPLPPSSLPFGPYVWDLLLVYCWLWGVATINIIMHMLAAAAKVGCSINCMD